MLSILLLNSSRQAGDFGSKLVASSKILVAMATNMVLTWRVAQWIEHPPGVWEVMGSITVRESGFFFVPRSFVHFLKSEN